MGSRHAAWQKGSASIVFGLLLLGCGAEGVAPLATAVESASTEEPADTLPATTEATHEPAGTQPAQPAKSPPVALAADERSVRAAATFAPIGTHVADLPLPDWFRDGEVVPELMPEYMPVADEDGFVIGYALNTLRFPDLSPEQLRAAGRHLIVDEAGTPIGEFNDEGTPELQEDRDG